MSAIISLGNSNSMQFECVGVMHGGLFVPVIMYCSDKMEWREKIDR